MILVAIGANLPGIDGGPPVAACRRAAEAIGLLAGLRLVCLSRWYVTEPVPPSAQPDYVNGVARLRGSISPEALLAALHSIEAGEGRHRSAPDAARTLDLDIVAMGDLVRPGPAPILPHPRAHLRAFVLVPLAEVAPGWVHPVLRRPVEALIADLPPAATRVL